MKTIIRTMMALAIAAITFTACEDVPEPYLTPTPSNGNTPQEEAIASGDGTLANPFNAVAATKAAKALGSGNVSEQMYYIKGKVASIATKDGVALNYDQGTYGNASFYISDDGTSTNQFYCYRVLYLGNKKWTQGSGDILKEGDEVIVCAKLTLYNNTPETQQNEGFLYSLNGKSEGGAGGDDTVVDPKGTGTEADPFNVAAAIAKCKEIGSTATSEKYYVKGIAVSEGTPDASYGNATFDIADVENGTNKFKAFQVLGTNGEKMPATYKIPVGAVVILYGPIYNYSGNTPETAGKGAAYIVSVNGKSTEVVGGGGDTPSTPTGDIKSVTVAEFNAAAESTDVWYQLTGTVKNLTDGDIYGNFDLEDETGSVYVYGLLSEKGSEKKKFQELVAAKGITNGCKLTIVGNRGSYKDKIEVMNAYFVSIEGGNTPGGDTPGGDTPGGGGSTVTSLTNGDFETWADGLPTGWKSASSASSATLSQSTDAHGGSYSCNVNGKEGSNVRLASQEINLAAGTYVYTFYAKATTADVAQVRPGYAIVVNGTINSSSGYKYGDYASINNNEWTKVTQEFTLEAETTVCLLVMNPKKSNYSSGKDALVDDATLTKK